MLLLTIFLALASATTPVEATATTASAKDIAAADVEEEFHASLAIGLAFQKLALPPHPQYSLSQLHDVNDYHVILVMTCHQRLDDSEDIAARCCSGMIEAAKHARQKITKRSDPTTVLLLDRIIPTTSDHDSNSNSNSNRDIIRQCQEHGSMVPSLDDSRNEHSLLTLRFIYSAAASKAMLSDQQHQQHNLFPDTNLYVWATTATAKNDSEQPTEVQQRRQEQQEGAWLEEIRMQTQLPLWIQPLLVPPRSSRTRVSNHPAAVDFSSILSQAGGMHRLMKHQIVVPFESIVNILQQEQKQQDATISTSSVTLRAFFLLLIPSDMFMDVEDAFETGHHDDAWNVQLVTDNGVVVPSSFPSDDNNYYGLSLAYHQDNNSNSNSNSKNTINIEQPAFDSPQHAVGISLEFTLSDKSVRSILQQEEAMTLMVDTNLVIQFSTKVHLRYPAPVERGDESLYRPVLMTPPLWLSGVLQSSSSSSLFTTNTPLMVGSTTKKWNWFGYHPPSSFSASSAAAAASTTTTTWVASANKVDFVWVASLTVVFSVLGAITLGYEISKIL